MVPAASQTFGEDDTYILHDVVQDPDETYARLRTEILWQRMMHRAGEVPRLVAVQGEIDNNGSYPIYRHPADHAPQLDSFHPEIVEMISSINERLGHKFNHALVQLYRSGEDNISEHSDKTLDILMNTPIVNVSLGAQRTMTLRTKKAGQEDIPRRTEKVAMPHGSAFVLGPNTNMRWLHSVRADKRMLSIKATEETAFDGERISITLRCIATFVNSDRSLIWGQGARGKSQDLAEPVSKDAADGQDLLVAFGVENHSTTATWDEIYGPGSNVIDLS